MNESRDGKRYERSNICYWILSEIQIFFESRASWLWNMHTLHSKLRRNWAPTTEYTEWQWPLSGVHSIMMEKLAQAGECGWVHATPFQYIYHHIQSCGVRSSWEGRYTFPLFLLYPNISSVAPTPTPYPRKASTLAIVTCEKPWHCHFYFTCKVVIWSKCTVQYTVQKPNSWKYNLVDVLRVLNIG